jgi:tetratricopeptide (TPR) repeat protein
MVAVSFVVFCSLLTAQQAPADSGPAAPNTAQVQASNGPGVAFQFTKADDDLLAAANAIDAQYEKKGLVLHDPVLQAYIDSVCKRVLGDRPVPEKVTFRFLVLRDPTVNAFALANGSVYIPTGLLSLLENEAQLAGVIAHETAHVYERHSYLENRSRRKKFVATEIILVAANSVVAGYGSILGSVVTTGVGNLVLNESIYGYSRELESQADRDGLAAVTVAGYDPHAMAATFELLDKYSALEYEPQPTFYQDHPQLTKRRKEALAFADAHTRKGVRSVTTEDYLTAVLTAIAPAIVDDANNDIESRRPRTAVVRATRLVNAFPGNPQYQVLLGSAYRLLGAKTALPTKQELTSKGEDQQREEVLEMTEQREQEVLLKSPEGQATLKENYAKAEKAFLTATQTNPQYALAYRELGSLYEDESRYSDAVANYQQYLQLLPPTSLDRLRIKRRLAQCQSHQTGQAHP